MTSNATEACELSLDITSSGVFPFVASAVIDFNIVVAISFIVVNTKLSKIHTIDPHIMAFISIYAYAQVSVHIDLCICTGEKHTLYFQSSNEYVLGFPIDFEFRRSWFENLSRVDREMRSRGKSELSVKTVSFRFHSGYFIHVQLGATSLHFHVEHKTIYSTRYCVRSFALGNFS